MTSPDRRAARPAYSDDSCRRKQGSGKPGAAARTRQPPCKPRASYLKPKEIQESAQVGAISRFDLRHPLNYLKVFAPSPANMIAQ
jgi:hypothetical protein